VSVKWRPLLSAHSRMRRTSDKSLTQSFDVLKSSKWRLSSWTFSFCCRRCFSYVSHPQQYSIATRDTVVPMNIEVLTKYPLSRNDRIVVLEIRLHSESPMLYRPALHGNWNALGLARRALKDKFHANGSTHSCVAKSSGISAVPCTKPRFFLPLCMLCSTCNTKRTQTGLPEKDAQENIWTWEGRNNLRMKMT